MPSAQEGKALGLSWDAVMAASNTHTYHCRGAWAFPSRGCSQAAAQLCTSAPFRRGSADRAARAHKIILPSVSGLLRFQSIGVRHPGVNASAQLRAAGRWHSIPRMYQRVGRRRV